MVDVVVAFALSVVLAAVAFAAGVVAEVVSVSVSLASAAARFMACWCERATFMKSCMLTRLQSFLLWIFLDLVKRCTREVEMRRERPGR